MTSQASFWESIQSLHPANIHNATNENQRYRDLADTRKTDFGYFLLMIQIIAFYCKIKWKSISLLCFILNHEMKCMDKNRLISKLDFRVYFFYGQMEQGPVKSIGLYLQKSFSWQFRKKVFFLIPHHFFHQLPKLHIDSLHFFMELRVYYVWPKSSLDCLWTPKR